MTCSRAQAAKHMREELKMNDKKIKMSTVYGECLKLGNKYYDTDSVLNYAVIHGGFTIKRTDKMRMAEKRFLNRLYGIAKRGNSK